VATQVQIWNRALLWVKRRPVSGLTDTTVEAEACRNWYDTCREELLALYDWPFATLTVELAEHAEDPPADWAYRFGLPGDARWIREVLTTGQSPTDPPNPFKLELLADKTAVTLLTNVNPAQLRYTFDCEDEALFDTLFASALAAHLGAMLAVALNEDVELEARMAERARGYIGEARLHTRVSEYVERPESPAARARL
jgi:hypothetical protein